MSDSGLAVILSLGSYTNDANQDQFNAKVNNLVDIQSTIWGEKNMNYDLVSLDEKSGFLSLNSLVDFIKEIRFKINNRKLNYLVINIICKGNAQYLFTSDNQKISWLQIYELFSFAKQFFIPTVFCIDAYDESNDSNITAVDADYDSLNVFGFVSSEIDYFGFITNVLYERKDALHLTDVISHIMIWNKYIFTVPKEIDWDNDDHDAEYERRPATIDEDNDANDAFGSNSMFAQQVKNVTATEPGANNWSITYSIDRKAWGPFLCKYDYSVYVHDNNNNRKDVRSVALHIERPIGTQKESEFKKILQNGSFINQTIREEGRYAVGTTAFCVTVTDLHNKALKTPKIFI